MQLLLFHDYLAEAVIISAAAANVIVEKGSTNIHSSRSFSFSHKKYTASTTHPLSPSFWLSPSNVLLYEDFTYFCSKIEDVMKMDIFGGLVSVILIKNT